MARRIWLAIVLFAAASAGQAEEFQVFFGLLHGHTSFSDGSGTPDDAFNMAKEAGLHFIAITEHNHKAAAGKDGVFLTPANYGQLIQSARDHTREDEFLAIWGQEVSTISAGNHANVFFANEIVDMEAGDFKSLYEEWLPSHAEVPFIQFNHPGVKKDQNPNTKAKERNNDYGIDDYDQDFGRLLEACAQHVALIELIIGPAFSEDEDKPHHNGKHESDYLFYLNKGFRLAPSAGQDNHNKTWGVATHARMGVWAKRLTRGDIVDAIRARRCYASEDDNLQVQFTVNDQPMGSTLNLPATETARIEVSIQDPDEPEATYRVRLFYDDAVGGDEAKVVENVSLDEAPGKANFVHTPSAGGYYFVKVTQQSDHADDAWTAPVWIGSELSFAVAGNTDDPQKTNITWSEANDYVGHEVTVSGGIIRSFNYKDQIVFFNFDADYENTLTLILLKDQFEAFGGAKALQDRLTNKSVRVRGKISLYKGERIQLRLENPEQILSSNEGEEGND